MTEALRRVLCGPAVCECASAPGHRPRTGPAPPAGPGTNPASENEELTHLGDLKGPAYLQAEVTGLNHLLGQFQF